MLKVFYLKLNSIIQECVQLKVCRKPRFPIWYKQITIRTYKNKLRSHKRWKRDNNPYDYYCFSQFRSTFKQMVVDDYNAYINNVEIDINSNVNTFWKYVKKKRSANSPKIPVCVRLGSLFSNNYQECVNIFSKNFNSYHSSVDNQLHGLGSTISEITNFNYVDLTVECIEQKILKLDVTKSAGPDDIPPIFLKKCSHSLSTPLKIIFQKSLSLGIFPDYWKYTYITPIHKKGSTTEVSNYRPISKLSALSKLFESLITDYLNNSFRSIFIKEQHGFIRGRSTVTNLVNFVEYVNTSVDHKKQVDVVYTDLEKAFDRVNHDLLILKLNKLGVGDPLLSWIRSYLNNRKLTVVTNGFRSDEYIPKSGVPQGSHLGPVLFLLFINDINQCIRYSKFLLYADDLKIYKQICSISDANEFQLDLNSIANYFQENLLSLNIEKCSAMRYTKNIVNRFDIVYLLNGSCLQVINEIKDLGVIFDYKLKFDSHINMITNKAFKMIGFIFRSAAAFRRLDSLKLLYYALVRSNLEYCSQIWNPGYEIYSRRIESVQSRFAYYVHRKRLISDLPQFYSYSTVISKMNISTLKNRRLLLDMMFLFKSIHKLVDSDSYIGGITFYTASFNTRNVRTFYYTSSRTNLGCNSPLMRMMQKYNDNFERSHITRFDLQAFRKYILENID